MPTGHVRACVFENMDYHKEPIVPTPIHVAMVHVGGCWEQRRRFMS